MEVGGGDLHFRPDVAFDEPGDGASQGGRFVGREQHIAGDDGDATGRVLPQAWAVLIWCVYAPHGRPVERGRVVSRVQSRRFKQHIGA